MKTRQDPLPAWRPEPEGDGAHRLRPVLRLSAAGMLVAAHKSNALLTTINGIAAKPRAREGSRTHEFGAHVQGRDCPMPVTVTSPPSSQDVNGTEFAPTARPLAN